jgi:Bacterial Ig domain
LNGKNQDARVAKLTFPTDPPRRARLTVVAVALLVVLVVLGWFVVRPDEPSVTTSAGSGATGATSGTTARRDPGPSRAVTSVRSGDWTDPAVWKGRRAPDANDTATIAAGHTVTYDATGNVAGVKVDKDAVLSFAPARPATLVSTGNVVVEGRLAMKPARPDVQHLLRFEGIDEGRFKGGGLDPIPSDVGLWVMGDGVLDTEGADKTDWTRVKGAVAAGASSITLGDTPTGWRAGDDLSIAPTEPPSAGEVSWNGFDEGTIADVSGATVELSRATRRPHPAVNGRWTAEVMNLTRNVAIEGTPGGRAHIFIRSTRPQSIKNTAIRHMGPRKRGEEEFTEVVAGRYGLHFHHAMDGSRGSVVSGTVVRDTASHAFVAHMSHGVTFDSTVSYNTFDEAYWWDPPTERYPEPPDNFSHDIVYQNAMAAKVHYDPEFRGYRLTGFFLGTGLRNVIRGCVAVGIAGNGDSSGFSWPEVPGVNADGGAADGSNSWVFHDNIAHNNLRQGIFVWQNNGNDHVVERFTGYHNGGAGVRWGAYTNRYHFIDNQLYGNAEGQFFALGLGGGGANHQYDGFKLVGSTLDAAAQSDYALLLPARSVVEPEAQHLEPGGMILRNTFAGYRKAGVNLTAEELDDNPYLNNWLLVNNTWKHPDQRKDFLLTSSAGSDIPADTVMRVQDARHGRIELRRPGQGGTLNQAWKAGVARSGGGGDVLPPLISLTSPGFGDDALAGGFAVAGKVPVSASGHDDVGVARVEFLVDGAVKTRDTKAPYAYTWDAGGLPEGSSHTVTARAFDAAGHVAEAETKVVIGKPQTHVHR